METGKTERKVIIQHVNNNRMLQTVATNFLLHSGWHVSNSFARISHWNKMLDWSRFRLFIIVILRFFLLKIKGYGESP